MGVKLLINRGPSSTFFNLSSVSISLPIFFCLFLSWASSSTPPSPPPTPASVAAETLRRNGYSLFASAIDAAVSDTDEFNRWNGSGTLFVSPDFTFFYSSARFKNGKAPMRPTASILSYHTLREILRWKDLKARSDSDAFLTFSPRRCIFKFKNHAGRPCFAGRKKPENGDYFRVRQPDLFVSEDLIIHGVDGVLDPSSASICTDADTSMIAPSPTTAADFSYYDHAVRTLRKRGYGVVSTALATQRSDLVNLTGITVFAPKDEALFKLRYNYRYDLRYHVVPRRIRFTDLSILPFGSKIETLASGEDLVVGSINGVTIVNGVKIDSLEIYHNAKVVLLSVSCPLHISVGHGVPVDPPLQSPSSGIVPEGTTDSGDDESETLASSSPSTLPLPTNEGGASPSTTFSENDEEDLAGDSPQSPLPAAVVTVSGDVRCRTKAGVSPASVDAGIVSALSVGIESYCPVSLLDTVDPDVATTTE